VNVDSHIIAPGELAQSGMQANPDANRCRKGPISQSSLNPGGRIDGIQRASKYHKERIALGADLRPFMFADHLSEDAVMLPQECNATVSKSFEKPGRPSISENRNVMAPSGIDTSF
jgi:hypothetical protein